MQIKLGGLRIATATPSATGGYSSILYYHRDRLGSVIATSTPGGVVGAQYRYTVYGVVDKRVGETAANASDLGYTGALTLSNGLVYLHARVYAPWGRIFLQPDNVDPRRYAYAGGDPVNAIDPGGHSACFLGSVGLCNHAWQRQAGYLGATGVDTTDDFGGVEAVPQDSTVSQGVVDGAAPGDGGVTDSGSPAGSGGTGLEGGKQSDNGGAGAPGGPTTSSGTKAVAAGEADAGCTSTATPGCEPVGPSGLSATVWGKRPGSQPDFFAIDNRGALTTTSGLTVFRRPDYYQLTFGGEWGLGGHTQLIRDRNGVWYLSLGVNIGWGGDISAGPGWVNSKELLGPAELQSQISGVAISFEIGAVAGESYTFPLFGSPPVTEIGAMAPQISFSITYTWAWK